MGEKEKALINLIQEYPKKVLEDISRQAHGKNPYMDPVHKSAGEWFFWDETWSNRVGPFSKESEARAALSVYCDLELNRTKANPI